MSGPATRLPEHTPPERRQPESKRAGSAGESGLPRLLPPSAQMATAEPRDHVDFAAHLHRHGLARFRGAALIEQAGAAGLTGRGGAAFPVARKLAAVAAARRPVIVVGNAAEGEPASSKDAALLWFAPHLVLDGLQAAAEAVGARTAYLYLHAADRQREPDLAAHIRMALASRAAAGIDRASVELVEAPSRFLAGEETALVAKINGRAARPQDKARRVVERGVGGRPTLVQNVETLANLALVARHGAAWFRGVGTADEPGSVLCTVRDAAGRVRIVETAIGTPLDRLVCIGDDVQALLAGGYHGGWLAAGVARHLSLSNADLRPAGAMIGTGVLVALPAAYCGLAETAHVARSLALESAGQCGPCRNGLPGIAAALATVAEPRPAERELADIRRWAGLVAGRGACHHPDGTVRFVASALDVFAREIAGHGQRRCTATRSDQFLPLPVAPLSESDWR
ncbi:MAG TPA: NADH-ubiquinone oxidoreductase-F iron-sulfur binding region domain-containing protein [Streptosporangiaceae bacterium]|nr:NADH-ubiquinone oxidoreductase-F iron-sulfur binding region domain-containing protein [Streptosporangiaceae bacterium]